MPKIMFEIRQILALLLIAVLWAEAGMAKPPAFSPREPDEQAKSIRSQLSAIHAETPIEVRLLNKEKVRGQLAGTDADGFALRTASAERRIRFDEVQSLKVVQSRHSRTGTWIAIGVLAGVAVVALAIILKYKSNE